MQLFVLDNTTHIGHDEGDLRTQSVFAAPSRDALIEELRTQLASLEENAYPEYISVFGKKIDYMQMSEGVNAINYSDTNQFFFVDNRFKKRSLYFTAADIMSLEEWTARSLAEIIE